MIEQNKFLAWHTNQAKMGLIDITFQAGEGCFAKNATSEEFFKEANHVNELYANGEFISRPDVF